MTSPEPTAVLRVGDLTLGYGERPAVSHLDLVVHPGEAVAVTGPNGSGKSTLVRGLLGLVPVLGGEIELFGVPAPRFRERHRIGYVPQRQTVGGAVPSTVEEVVASGLLAGRRWFAPRRAGDGHAVRAAIDAVRLGDHRRSPVRNLSGGQQRRALIARALVGRPDLMIMDEPTAGVDAENQASLVHTLSEQTGMTLVIVTHEVPALLPILTRIVRLENGRLVKDVPSVRVEA